MNLLNQSLNDEVHLYNQTNKIITHKCVNKCCTILIKPYKENFIFHKAAKKAGVFIYDPNTQRVLLVQSRGNFWGPPKGSCELDELNIDCAIREVKEETGLLLDKTKLLNSNNHPIIIKGKYTYYYTEIPYDPGIKVQHNNTEEANDANGITWIKLNCLKQLVEKGNMRINKNCRILLDYYLDVQIVNI